MFNLFKNNEEKEKFMTEFENPFHPDKVEKIQFTIENSFWSNYKIQYKSRITFKTESTHAFHDITANDFPQLVKKTEEFIKNL